MPFKSDEQRKAVMAALKVTGAATLFGGAVYLAYRARARRMDRMANWRIAQLEHVGAHRMSQRMRMLWARPVKTRINLLRERPRVRGHKILAREFNDRLDAPFAPL